MNDNIRCFLYEFASFLGTNGATLTVRDGILEFKLMYSDRTYIGDINIKNNALSESALSEALNELNR